jgi:hypothetical protein
MDPKDMRELLLSPELDLGGYEDNIIQTLCHSISRDPESENSQELLLLTLERRGELDTYEGILEALTREVGLFPYLDKESLGFADRIAYEFHRPNNMDFDEISYVFHRPQARVYRELMSGRNVVLSAPTSFGKSLIIDAVIASQRFNNVLIIVSTIALIDETRRRLHRFKDSYKIITHSMQEPSVKNVYVLTQERAIGSLALDKADFFVMDEFYKLSISPGQDMQTRCYLKQSISYTYQEESAVLSLRSQH